MQTLSNLFKALSDETRLRILKLLEHGELCVCDIVAALGMIQPKVSFHLGVMKDAGLIKDRKQGRWIHYRIDDSDMFKRLILLSVLERIPDTVVAENRKRLKKFLTDKNGRQEMRQKTAAAACLCERQTGG
ncbi:MAG: metalloregulator ArsR/SmtB family transcription factor [Nitrospirae bacterium]|nr:metalloregulator ArsR/SmtB family transcription factor [Nitrospirota bacterium]MCL5977537.1 metalloregulator ArsR/SmtB family transcription factor [Nitrospirota bacterium]